MSDLWLPSPFPPNLQSRRYQASAGALWRLRVCGRRLQSYCRGRRGRRSLGSKTTPPSRWVAPRGERSGGGPSRGRARGLAGSRRQTRSASRMALACSRCHRTGLLPPTGCLAVARAGIPSPSASGSRRWRLRQSRAWPWRDHNPDPSRLCQRAEHPAQVARAVSVGLEFRAVEHPQGPALVARTRRISRRGLVQVIPWDLSMGNAPQRLVDYVERQMLGRSVPAADTAGTGGRRVPDPTAPRSDPRASPDRPVASATGDRAGGVGTQARRSSAAEP